jgi:nitroimidazol reductase NimA-like FMN-containing flavoprotein (pyridoxamine 5'-phosphate oxidase superfamily)
MANPVQLKPISEKNLSLPKYGMGPVAWDRAREHLEQAWNGQGPGADSSPRTLWIATIHPDGRPHVMPAGINFYNGKFYLVSGAGTRKSQNLAVNPRCTIALAARGIELSVEGEAQKVSDEGKLNEIAAVYGANGWAPKIENGAFVHEYGAPSAGAPPWNLYEITPKTVFGFATAAPQGATRWQL